MRCGHGNVAILGLAIRRSPVAAPIIRQRSLSHGTAVLWHSFAASVIVAMVWS